MPIFDQILARILRTRLYLASVALLLASRLLLLFPSPSLRTNEAILTTISLFAFLSSLFCGLLLAYREQVKHWPIPLRDLSRFLKTTFSFYLRLGLLFAAVTLPLFVPMPLALLEQNFFAPYLFGALFLLLSLAVLYPVHLGGITLLLARGHSCRSFRDSLKSFRALWLETTFVLCLFSLPTFASLPFHLLAFYVPPAQWLVEALLLALAPYQAAIVPGSLCYLAQSLARKQPQLVASSAHALPMAS